MASAILTPRELTVAALQSCAIPPNDLVQVPAELFEALGMPPADTIMHACELTGMLLYTLRITDECPQKIGI